MAGDENPVEDTLIAMTEASLDRSTLPDRELMLTRLAALVAIDATAASYVMNLGAGAEAGLTAEDVQGVLVAVAPVVGTVRVLAATVRIAEGLGFAIGIAEDELGAAPDN